MTPVQQALALLEAHPALANFRGPTSRWLLDDAEVPLGFRFPPSYREFLLHLGGGTFAGELFLGVGPQTASGEDPAPDQLEVLRTTNEARAHQDLPWEYLPVQPHEPGFLVLDLSRVDGEGEAPALLWTPDSTALERTVLAPSYGAWFLGRLQALA